MSRLLPLVSLLSQALRESGNEDGVERSGRSTHTILADLSNSVDICNNIATLDSVVFDGLENA